MSDDLVLMLALLAGAAALGYATYVFFRQRKLIVDTPTSGAGAVLVAGPVEVQGSAQPPEGDEPLRTPIGGAPCVWYETVIKERRSSGHGKRRRTRWVVIDRDRSERAFLIRDATGSVRVLPHDASVDAHQRARPRPNSLDELPPQLKDRLPVFNSMLGKLSGSLGTLGLRFEEHWIPPGANTFVLGTAAIQTTPTPGRAGGGHEAVILKGDAPAFIISRRSEREILMRKTFGLVASSAGTLACLALAIYFALA